MRINQFPLHHVLASAVSQSEIDRRIIKDFKFSLKEKKTSKTIRIMMNISIALFVLLTILQTVTLNIEIKKFNHLEDTFNLVNLVFSRFSNVVKIIVEMRVAINIINKMESKFTTITSNGNRMERYQALLQICTSNLKAYETELPKNQQWNLIKELSERKNLNITEFTYDYNNVLINYTRELTLQEAMQSFIIKSSIFEEYWENMSEEQTNAFTKNLNIAFNYVSTNGIRSILQRLMESSDSLFESVTSSYSKEQTYLQTLYCIIGIVGMISLCTLIPILNRINSSIKKILNYFAILKKADFVDIMERFVNFRSLISKHFRYIKADYSKINFAEDITRDKKKGKENLTNEQQNKLRVMLNQR
jgi:hypothetical protein